MNIGSPSERGGVGSLGGSSSHGGGSYLLSTGDGTKDSRLTPPSSPHVGKDG